MGRGNQIGQAQNSAQSQIDTSNQQRQQMLDLMNQQLGKRDAQLDPLYSELQSSQTGAIDTANQGNTAGLADAQGLVDQTQQYANEGLTPEAVAALRTEQTDQIPGQFNSALSSVQANLSRRGLGGGDTPAGGEASRQFQPLYAAKANAIAGANRQTILAKEQARRQGLTALAQALAQKQAARQSGLAGILGAQGAGQGLAGTISQTYNPSAFIGGADSALGAQGSATGIRTGLIKPGFMDYLSPVLGAAAGAAGSYFGRLPSPGRP